MLFINTIQTTLARLEMPEVLLPVFRVPSFEVPAFEFAEVAKQVDEYCSVQIGNVVEFLDKHPGIAMALSPSTVLHRCAQKHVDNQL